MLDTGNAVVFILMTKAKKKRPKYNQNAAIRGALRRAFSRSPIVREVLLEHRREIPKYRKDGSLCLKPAVQYKCNICTEWVGSTKVQVDHVSPVIPVNETFTSWDKFIERLFCTKDNLKPICKFCHDIKSLQERRLRKQFLAEQSCNPEKEESYTK